MLQITIEHYKDEASGIQKICTGTELLAQMQDNNTIDLDVCIPYINQEIVVYHIYVGEEKKNFMTNAILKAVEIDPVTNTKCIRFAPKK